MPSRHRGSFRTTALALRLDTSGHTPASSPYRYTVVAAGKSFFHITEQSTGRVKGFRQDHLQACALADQLERQDADAHAQMDRTKPDALLPMQ